MYCGFIREWECWTFLWRRHFTTLASLMIELSLVGCLAMTVYALDEEEEAILRGIK